MGVLKVKVGGSWIDVPSYAAPVVVLTGSFTPVWTFDWTLGSGAVNFGRYQWIGGPNVGDQGSLTVMARASLGTGFVVGTNGLTLALPSGFECVPADPLTPNGEPVGICRFNDASPATSYTGPARLSSVTAMRLMVVKVDSTYGFEANITSAIPFTWAASDNWSVTMTMMAKKV